MINYAQILVAEDEAIVAKDVSSRLRHLGYAVPAVAPTGEEAVEQTDAIRPDLVLMDIRLKGRMDGIEAATQIRRRHDVPIIYLTAYADDDTVARAQLTEPAGYLLKPFVERELQTTIEMALYRHRGERRLHAREQWFANTLRSIGHAVVVTDESGRVNFMNAAAENLTGLTFSFSLGKLLTDLFQLEDPRTHAPLKHPVLSILHDGQDMEAGRHAVLRKSGCGQIPIDYSAGPIRDNTGTVIGLVMLFAEVTRQLEPEPDPVPPERPIAAAMDVAPEFLFILDREGRIMDCNATVVRTLGWDRSAMVGKALADVLLTPPWQGWLRRELAYYVATGQGPCLDKRIELTALRSDGTAFPAELVIQLLETSGPSAFAVFLRDITDRKRDEEKLDHHVRALQESLARARMLSGILPICSSCKKIRTGADKWIPIEHYLHQHTAVQFSHGYCPDCAATIMDEFRQHLGETSDSPPV